MKKETDKIVISECLCRRSSDIERCRHSLFKFVPNEFIPTHEINMGIRE